MPDFLPSHPLQEPPPPLPRWKCVVAYDGTDFNGWQSQRGGQTIQDLIETSLAHCLDRPQRIVGAGRTDSGVHARGQVFHFPGLWPHGTDTLLRALNSRLPSSIRILSVAEASPDFSARFSALGKRYVYRIHRHFAPPFETRYYHSHGGRPFQTELLQEAAKQFLGTHDFTGFAVSSTQEENPVKTITRSVVFYHGERIHYLVEGSGFLYKQVRSMAGALLQVARGKLLPAEIGEILASCQRTTEVATAPAQGLSLERVFYPR
ncbi:MAG: tRNA pseudouridine(38-40) synthase TruA [Puniceicoccaceae bacterium]